ncbi:hypothetical protein J2Z49_002774 [Desulfofundulus luciae]|uniref:Uncharacterized protein n=1 Tax=Desulfofundulus luciae TaxID=74702 RepID=A0ABU0B4K2_9FIRM|nr:hypothetical protein [Desulfofundulus luciae]MDQ0287644.1 hypothetical protein [Desulfofundulus luciae]
MFFEQWWQGVVFGFFTTLVMLVIGSAFTIMWKKYEDVEEKPTHSCDAQGHH